MVRDPVLSIIISTYNQPKLLRLCLESYRNQTEKNFEIIIADDGSTIDTKETIEAFSDIVTKHVWHPDNGFQKTKILNKAIFESKSNYLLFTDGDCIAPKNLVEVHLISREENVFLSGSYYKLEKESSEKITKELINKNLFKYETLMKLGHKIKFKAVKFLAPLSLRKLLDKITPTKATWNGHCSSGWKKDLIKVNGFDERMAYGGEDRELGERLENLGVRGKQIRHQSCMIHLYHKQGYITDEGIRFNENIRKEIKKNKSVWTNFGLEK